MLTGIMALLIAYMSTRRPDMAPDHGWLLVAMLLDVAVVLGLGAILMMG